MTAQPPPAPGGPGTPPEPGYDLEYDLAHEVPGFVHRVPAHPPVQVATQTDDDGGDYTYDLAHDIPRS